MSKPVIIMAAPNGSRWSKKDHPSLPITIEEITTESLNCANQGASIVHVHVRDNKGSHTLDAGLYKELINEISQKAPELLVQITTEAVGKYSPKQQQSVVRDVKPKMVSIALKEMIPDTSFEETATHFYHWAATENIHIQHILYDIEDIKYYLFLLKNKKIPLQPSAILYVVGRYTQNLIADEQDLLKDLSTLKSLNRPWFCCAFGHTEHKCMKIAIQNAGHCRVGFENNFFLENGTKAKGTYEIVKETSKMIIENGKKVADTKTTTNMLWPFQ